MSKRRHHTQLSRFIVGDLQVHPDRGCVVRNGVDIPLEPRPIQVLEALARKAGEAMTSTQLQIVIWKTDPRKYDDNAVTKALSVLRKSLGDDARNPRYIEMLKGRGYRLIQPVSFQDDYRRLPKPTDPWKGGSPFVGLAAFEARHAKVFAGRTQATGDLLDAMRGQIDNGRRFVLIAGSSGCGKTSLLRAGVLPHLTASGGFGGLRALSVATCDLAAIQSGDAMLTLANALSGWALHDGVEDRPVFAPQPIESLKRHLTEAPETIAPAIAEAFRRCADHSLGAQPHAHLLLVIDHAEALVRTVRDLAVRSAFEHALCALCDAPHALVVMIVRADYAPDLAQALPALNERKAGGGHLDLLAPNRGEIAEMIRDPAWQAGLEFDVDEQDGRLDDTLRDAANGQPDALPLLQHTLQLLYEDGRETRILAWDAYRRIGGLEGAIAHHAEEVFVGLPVDAQASLDAVLTQLIVIQSDSDAVTARQAPLESLPESARTLVNGFVAGRLFTRKLHDGRLHFGVVHEAVLRRWPRAVEWVQENRRLLMAKARLKQAAQRWSNEGHTKDHLLNPGRPLAEALEVAARFPEDIDDDIRGFLRGSEKESLRKLRTRRIAAASLSVLTMLSLAFAVVTLQARHEAEQRERESKLLSEFLLGPLAEELRKREMLGLLGDIGTVAIDYLAYRDLDDLNASQIANAARAYRTVGEALLKSNDSGQAMTSFIQAHSLADQVLRRDPRHEAALFERGNASYWIGLLHFNEKRYDAAGTHWLAYRKDSEHLISVAPGKPRSQQELSYADSNLGSLALRQGDTRRAMRYFRESISRKKALMDAHQDNLDYRYDYIDSLSWIASTLAYEGRLRDAAQEYDQHISMLEAMSKEKRSANRWRSRLANYLMLSALISIDLDDIAKSRKNATEAIRIIEQLAESFPDDQRWTRDLAKARLILAEACALQSDRATASTLSESIASDFAKIDSESRKSTTWRWIDARARLTRAIMRADGPAMTEADRAIADLHRLAKENDSEEIAESHAHALLLRGNLHARRGNDALATIDWRSAATAIETLPRKGNAYRSWIWAQAMHHIAAREDVGATREWLTSIGYARRSID